MIERALSNMDIENSFGHFGNFIMIDSLGKRTGFMTDVNLSDFIKPNYYRRYCIGDMAD